MLSAVFSDHCVYWSDYVVLLGYGIDSKILCPICIIYVWLLEQPNLVRYNCDFLAFPSISQPMFRSEDDSSLCK